MKIKLFLMFIIVAPPMCNRTLAQSLNCEEALVEAEKAFDQGNFELIPGLLCDCFMKVKSKGNLEATDEQTEPSNARLTFKVESPVRYKKMIRKIQAKHHLTGDDLYTIDSCFCESRYTKKIISSLIDLKELEHQDDAAKPELMDLLIFDQKEIRKSIKKKNNLIESYSQSYEAKDSLIDNSNNYLTAGEKKPFLINNHIFNEENQTGIKKIKQGKIVVQNKRDSLVKINSLVIKDELEKRFSRYQKRRALILLSKTYLQLDDRFIPNLFIERLIKEYPTIVETSNSDPNFQKQYDYFRDWKHTRKISIGPVIGWNYVRPLVEDNTSENTIMSVDLQPARMIAGGRINYYPFNRNLSRLYIGLIGFRNNYKFLERNTSGEVKSLFIEDQIQYRIPIGFKYTATNTLRILPQIETFDGKFFINGGITLDWLNSSKTTYLQEEPTILEHQTSTKPLRKDWNYSLFLGIGFSIQFERNLIMIDVDLAKSMQKLYIEDPGLFPFEDKQYSNLNLLTTVTYEYRFNIVRKKYSPARSKKSFW